MNTFIKRVVCGFLAFLVLLVSVIIPDFSSFADEPINNSFGSLADGYTVNDLLFSDSYIYNYTVDVDKQYLKYCCPYESYFVHDNNSDMGSTIMTNMINSWTNNTYLQDTLFPNDLDGYHITQLYYYDYGPHLANIVVESDDLIIINGALCSSSPFRYHAYYYDINNAGGSAYTNLTDYGISTYNTINNDGFYSVNLSNRLQWTLFSDVPIYFTAMKNVSYPEGDFLVDTYNYNSVTNIYNAVKNNTDDTGFVIDRRTEKMIDSVGGGGVSPNDYGFLDGSFDALIYGSSFDDQGFFVSYQLNDDSATIKDQLYLKLNYQFDLDGVFSNNEFDYSEDYYSLNGVYDLYTLQDSSYINVDLNSVFSKMNTTDRTTIGQYQNIYKKFNNSGGGFSASPQTVNPLGAFDILYKNGLLTSAPIAYNIDNPLIQSLGGTYKGFNFQVGVNTSALYNESGVPEISRLDTCLITITISIYNVMTGEESGTYLYSYDYKSKTAVESGSLENGGTFGGSYNDGSQASISNPNSSELGYNIANGSQYPVTSGSSSNATGNYVIVQDSPYPYVLVDIPENEWIAKTPNLKTLLETYKDALATTKDESILPLIAQTYNYLPSEAMQYLIYGVGIIVMIGIWRAITRR